MSTWLAGRKTLTPMSTSRPPLIFRVALPLTTSPSWYVEITISQARIDALPAGEHDLAGLVLHPLKQDFDAIARLGRRLFFPLVQGNKAFRLVSDVDHNLVADNFDHLARNDPADLEALSTAEKLVEIG